jgi:predicted site-specific integrase-resolvase
MKVLGEKEVSDRTGISLQTLRNWRHLGKELAYIKLGARRIGYLEEDVNAFITGNRITPRAV